MIFDNIWYKGSALMIKAHGAFRSGSQSGQCLIAVGLCLSQIEYRLAAFLLIQ